MDKRTTGAWLINHTKKLMEVKEFHDFEDVELAGKCGLFLSNLSASHSQSDINKEKVNAIARVSHVKKTEISTIIKTLEDLKYIDSGKDGSLSVLGITTSSVLSHTSEIFENTSPTNLQRALIDLSETVSEKPKNKKLLSEHISDTYKLSTNETSSLFNQVDEIGLIDHEKLDEDKVYFNGHLFKRDNLEKTKNVLSSLKPEEIRNITEVDEVLSSNGCMPYLKVESILGKGLLLKLQSIGFYDLNEVSNTDEAIVFVTKPSAFSKFGSPFEEDALDLAKAFVSSLYYGMKYSTQGRGKITMLHALLKRLVNGYEVGPATAIGEDYKILELKRVIELRQVSDSSKYYMRLLKKDIGELALKVLEHGDASEEALLTPDIYSGNITNYIGPEEKRTFTRIKQTEIEKRNVADVLRTFRQ
ncbi:hypothetical protein [Elizabethkingia anophelis]|uniref:hypothetical protein n=1 Tax=Elizabethkingia anophelis TaxID=1117645 RepID=UPI000C6D31B7|nr:hypothetical protein [Elizabethkingia anophelis]MCT3760653.1 hypothetical protein [Elizabethkingia anophelis]PKR31669.1 hypothetical protein CWH99_13020 [Elizabethkingia anophelis]PKR34932.1 hypothetical protein CWI00_09670 [Elizabethkingia anophelis]